MIVETLRGQIDSVAAEVKREMSVLAERERASTETIGTRFVELDNRMDGVEKGLSAELSSVLGVLVSKVVSRVV